MTAPTPTDTELLLRACRLNPGDDAPRLALADELQETGLDDVAAYIRESIANHYEVGAPRRKVRSKIGSAYCKWIASLVGIASESDGFTCAGESWDQIVWGGRIDTRRAVFNVERGLPRHVGTTAPLLMESAAQMFLFPLTSCEVTDRKPERDDMIPDDVQWVWNCTSYPQKWNTWEDYSHNVPLPLWKNLPLEPPNRYWRQLRRGTFTSRANANGALRAAAFAFGRAAVDVA